MRRSEGEIRYFFDIKDTSGVTGVIGYSNEEMGGCASPTPMGKEVRQVGRVAS